MARRSSTRLLCLAIIAGAALFAVVATAAQAGARHHRDGGRRAWAGHAARHLHLGRARRVSTVARLASSEPLKVTTKSPTPAATISGSVNWEVSVAGANRVEFLVDGNPKWTETRSPYQYGGQARGFDTTKFADGPHTLTAVASSSKGRTGRSSLQVTIDNPGSGGNSTATGTGFGTPPPDPNANLIFSDDFDGAAGSRPNSSKWVAMNWCDRWGSLSCNTNRTDNVSLDGQGDLRIRAIKQNWTDLDGNTGTWTSGRLETQSHFSFTYGTIKARIKVPAGKGFWPAFWTNAASKTGWPATGEIDVMELLGHDPDTYYCSLHGSSNGTNHVSTTLGHTEPASLASGFHVYEARWTSSKVDYFVDGNPCGSISSTNMVPFTPQQLLVGMAVGGSWPGNPDSSTPSTGDMLVDWVRAYQ
jgi:beta-glucanase (GH16 family)